MNIDEMEWPLSKEELEYLYWEEEMLQKEIGDLFNRTSATVSNWFKKYNITTRHSSEYKRKTHKKFKEEVDKLFGEEYEVIGKYKNMKTKIKVKHNKCGNKYKVNPANLLYHESGCPYCANRRRTPESFKKEIKEKTNGEYTILGDYKNNKEKIKIRHNKCGYEYKVIPSNLISHGHGCPKCKNKRTHKEFKKIFYDYANEEYELLSKYKKHSIKIKVKHNKCGYEYKVAPYNFLRGVGCPKCAKSNYSIGEKTIEEILTSNKIKYFWQYKFEDCKNIQKLPFDFKIKNKPIVIEYNGRQHYEPIEYYGGDEQLRYRQKLDKIKKDYCKNNDIKFIEIPYWEKDNIEEILKNELKEML